MATFLYDSLASVERATDEAPDGFGGVKKVYSHIETVHCRVNHRSERDVLQDETLKAEVTNKIYTAFDAKEQDTFVINDEAYLVMKVDRFEDPIGAVPGHYRLWAKKIRK